MFIIFRLEECMGQCIHDAFEKLEQIWDSIGVADATKRDRQNALCKLVTVRFISKLISLIEYFTV